MRRLSTAAALLLLAGGLAVFGRKRWADTRPEVAARRAAIRYLTAIRAGDFDAAYGMLTEAARAQCSPEEFKLIRPAVVWDFADVRVHQAEGDAVFLRYAKSVQGEGTDEDWLLFTREGGSWRRPFNWSLLNKIEDAFEKGDAQAAHALARAAAEVDRRDPMAQAYLCEAAHGRGVMEEAERECEAAVALFKKYPSKLNPASLFHLYRILADVYKNGLAKRDKAVEQQSLLLNFPNLGPGDRCDILLARAETRVSMRDFDAALRDLRQAVPDCAAEADRAELSRASLALSGQATREAVALAQAHTREGGGTLLEWRRQMREELRAAMRRSGSRGEPPEEVWSAEHLGGPDYRVVVRAAGTALLTARVDVLAAAVTDVATGAP